MNEKRHSVRVTRAVNRAVLLELREVVPPADRFKIDTLLQLHDKILDDLDAVYAFFTEPEPQSLGVDAPRHGTQGDPATAPPSVRRETPGRVLTLIEGGKA